jgi:16S rRNA (guanine527-N7)-methyltransferase
MPHPDDAVSRETELLHRYAELVLGENQKQNLVASSTVPAFWARHIEDSLQLAPLVSGGTLVDIGSGAGLPGVVIACARPDVAVHLVEPRKRRAEFLERVATVLAPDVTLHVHDKRVESIAVAAVTTITARAVASLSDLFTLAAHIATGSTRWVLPKGRSARADLEEAAKSWQGEFSLIASVTDPDASIIVAERVRRRR